MSEKIIFLAAAKSLKNLLHKITNRENRCADWVIWFHLGTTFKVLPQSPKNFLPTQYMCNEKPLGAGRPGFNKRGDLIPISFRAVDFPWQVLDNQ